MSRAVALWMMGCLVCVGIALAQPPDILWTSELRGGGNWLGIINTRDGGYAVASASWPDDGRRFDNMILQKADSLGQPQWLRFYAQSDSNDVRNATGGRALRQMSDGGFVLAGGYYDGAFIVRTDSLANVLWVKTLPRDEFGILWAEDCDVGDDGNIVVVGDDRAVKLDDQAEGEVIWARSYDIGGRESLFNIRKSNQNGFLLLGVTYSIGHGRGDMYAVRIDEEGEVRWQDGYGTGLFEGCGAGVQTFDGGWCLAGNQKFGNDDSIHAMAIKITDEGEEVWQRVYSQYMPGNWLRSVTQTPDSCFVFGGHDGTASTFLLIRTDQEGEAHWRGRYRTPRGAMENCISIFLMEDGSYTLGGANSWGSCLIRTKPDTTHVGNEVVLLDPAFPSQFVVGAPYPNPFNSTTTITFGLDKSAPTRLAVYGLDGRVVAELLDKRGRMSYTEEGKITPPTPPAIAGGDSRTAIWNAAGVPAGEYLIRIDTGASSATRKVVLVK